MPLPEPKRFSIKDLAKRWGISEEEVCEAIRADHFRKLIVYRSWGGGFTHRYTIDPHMPPESVISIRWGGSSCSLEPIDRVWAGSIRSVGDIPWPGEGETLYIPWTEVEAFEKIHRIDPAQEPTPPNTGRVPLKLFPTPPGTTWHQVSIQFISNDAAKISVGKLTKTFMFAEMGFKDHKKGDQPDSLWRTLQTVFGRSNGEVAWKTDRIDPKARANLKTQVKQLRKRLQSFFGIEDDPFEPYRPIKAYKTKFKVVDESHH